MNRLHSILIIVGISIMLIMLLFPPFHVVYSSTVEIEKGYAFILNPPVFWGRYESTVDMSMLLFQIGTVVALLVSVHLFFNMYKSK
jgi:hypothetical protein